MQATSTRTAALRQAIDNEHARLREVLAGKTLLDLETRPANGKWSVAENLRHLIFAEQVQLGRFLPATAERSVVMNPTAEDRRNRMDTTQMRSPEEVLGRLALVHQETRVLAGDDRDAVGKALDVNLRHLRIHLQVIERLLRRA